MEDDISKKEKPEDHKTIAAIEKHSEAIRLIAAHVETLTNQIAVNNQTGENAAERRHTEELKVERGFLRWQKVSVITGGILALGTLIVVCIYTCQAWQANRLTREAIEAAQRPILSVKVADITLAVGKVPTAKFEIDNLGRIPALKVWLQHCADIAIIPDDKFVLPDCLKTKTPNPPSVIFPGYPQQEYAHGQLPMSPSEDAAIKGKVSAFYIMGLIRYADTQRADYFTRFCFRYPSLSAFASVLEVQGCPNPNANDAN